MEVTLSGPGQWLADTPLDTPSDTLPNTLCSSLTGLEMHNALEHTGSLYFGDAMDEKGGAGSARGGAGRASTRGGANTHILNRINDLVHGSQLSNVAAYQPTDCPTREKHGWLGDAQVTAEEAMLVSE